jgi:hypothetical protein
MAIDPDGYDWDDVNNRKVGKPLINAKKNGKLVK